MNYEDVVRDFAARTKKNLEFIEDQVKNDPNAELFEVTQLVNSMLGLLVFPQQRYLDQIPETPLSKLEQQGWPRIINRIESQHSATVCTNLKELVRYMRNGIAHFNLEFIADGKGQISGIKLWNCVDRQQQHRNWEVKLSLDDLRLVAYRFIDMLLTEGQ